MTTTEAVSDLETVSEKESSFGSGSEVSEESGKDDYGTTSCNESESNDSESQTSCSSISSISCGISKKDKEAGSGIDEEFYDKPIMKDSAKWKEAYEKYLELDDYKEGSHDHQPRALFQSMKVFDIGSKFLLVGIMFVVFLLLMTVLGVTVLFSLSS